MRNKKVSIFTLITMLLLIASCAMFTTDKDGTALKSMRVSYETIIADAGIRKQQNTITQVNLDEIVQVGKAFYASYNVAVNTYLLNQDATQHILAANNLLNNLKAVNIKYGGH